LEASILVLVLLILWLSLLWLRPYFRNGRQKQIWTAKPKKNGRWNSIGIFHFICLPQLEYNNWVKYLFVIIAYRFTLSFIIYHFSTTLYSIDYSWKPCIQLFQLRLSTSKAEKSNTSAKGCWESLTN
jgi:ABC-type Fe3+ transport system permease subunit